MIRTRVGYAGGQMDAPTYRQMGDHTETIQIDYDPSRVSYNQLLDIFWQSHQPKRRSWSQQYMNAVFYHNENQLLQAEASKTALSQKIGHKVETKVVPLNSFTMAEDYHQKYLLKGRNALEKELVRIYPHHRDLVDSTAAARLNGYVGGHGNKDQLSREIERLGLSIEGKKTLTELVRK
ncbi:MAG: peptide-methionine (S)-S-oxide reductase [Desulfobacterales bacterium]|nr:peptide-methionine (S)-S-oxide reductase [Desulfobacterales bacterium]